MKQNSAFLSFIVIVFIITISACFFPNPDTVNPPKTNVGDIGTLGETEFYHVQVIDSCQYLIYQNSHDISIAHKGNCKYCADRRNKELSKQNDDSTFKTKTFNIKK